MIAVSVCAALAAPLALSGCGSSDPQGAVMKYLNAWQAQNWNEYKAAVAPEKAKLTKDQEELAKQAFGQTKVKFSDIKMKTTYDKNNKNRARVSLIGGKTTYTARILGKWKTDTRDIGKMKQVERPVFDTVRIGDVWYVDISLG